MPRTTEEVLKDAKEAVEAIDKATIMLEQTLKKCHIAFIKRGDDYFDEEQVIAQNALKQDE